MSAAVVDKVDRALDRYITKMKTRGRDPEGFQTKTIAHLLRTDRSTASDMLQAYRIRQARQATRFVIACQGYGLAARWHILAKPDSDPKAMQRARAAAAKWSARDAAERIVSDIERELLPGAKGADIDARIALATDMMRRQAEVVVDFVASMMNGNTSP